MNCTPPSAPFRSSWVISSPSGQCHTRRDPVPLHGWRAASLPRHCSTQAAPSPLVLLCVSRPITPTTSSHLWGRAVIFSDNFNCLHEVSSQFVSKPKVLQEQSIFRSGYFRFIKIFPESSFCLSHAPICAQQGCQQHLPWGTSPPRGLCPPHCTFQIGTHMSVTRGVVRGFIPALSRFDCEGGIAAVVEAAGVGG